MPMTPNQFSSPPDPHRYNQQVWEVVRRIPPGKVATYGQIGLMISPPDGVAVEDYLHLAARWVGSALRRCPADVPWQRVINAQGKISLPGAGGLEQRQLLEAEGVLFDAKGRVNLKVFGWKEPEAAQLPLNFREK